MASTAGIVAYPGIACYDAAKAAIEKLTLRCDDYGAHRIRVNAVAPTAVATEMNQRQIAWTDDPAALGQRLENMTGNVVHHSADAKESGTAFLDKRKPNCVGR